MIARELDVEETAQRLRTSGLRLRVGPFVYSVRSPLPPVVQGIRLHYGAHPLAHDDEFVDFHVGVERPRGWRRWYKPLAHFRFDGEPPFNPLPAYQAFPLLEWGMNWCVSAHAHTWLIVHAAVLERGARCLLLPAPSGSGKSTLTAALMLRGWRLLSDELALIDPVTGHLQPLPRPVSLKNQSIDVIRAFDRDAVIGEVVPDTIKGSVAHLRPLDEHVRRAEDTAPAAWIVVPRFAAGAETRLENLPKARAFMLLADNAFNYQIHGRAGFRTLAATVDRSACMTLVYSRLDEAVAALDRLAGTPIVVPAPESTGQLRPAANAIAGASPTTALAV